MDTAQLALGLSLALAVWELSKYLLEGGRVRVRLRPGALDDFAVLHAGKTWKGLEEARHGSGFWQVEVAILDVENLGRTPVTISGPSLDVSRRRWQHRRQLLAPKLLPAPQSSQEYRVRLEPFDSARFVFDVWHELTPTGFNSVPERPLRVRGLIRVAGKSFARRSPWRQGWPVEPGQLFFMAKGAEIGLAAYRALWRQTHDDFFGRASTIDFALAVREEFPVTGPPPTQAQVRALLAKHHHGDKKDRGLVGVHALVVSRELKSYYGRRKATTEPSSGGG